MHRFEVAKRSGVANDAGVAVGTIYLRYDSAQPDLPQRVALSSFAPDKVANAPSPITEQIAAQFSDGMQRSEPRKDIDLRLAAHMAHGMVEGAIRDLMAGPERRPDEIISHTADAYARWLLGGQGDKAEVSANAADHA